MKNYIQIGTNNGNDEFKKIIEDLQEKSKIILIEPNPNLIEDIKTNYSKISNFHDVFILNVGVVTDKNINTLNIYGGGDGLSSILNRNSYGNVIGNIQFEPMTLFDIVDKYDINIIDLLHIDTEGYDYTILNSIDLEKIDIREIVCEEWPFDMDSTDEIKTGPTFFEECIRPKFASYTIESINIGGMSSYRFLKN